MAAEDRDRDCRDEVARALPLREILPIAPSLSCSQENQEDFKTSRRPEQDQTLQFPCSFPFGQPATQKCSFYNTNCCTWICGADHP